MTDDRRPTPHNSHLQTDCAPARRAVASGVPLEAVIGRRSSAIKHESSVVGHRSLVIGAVDDRELTTDDLLLTTEDRRPPSPHY
jgi:hypothetical protein